MKTLIAFSILIFSCFFLLAQNEWETIPTGITEHLHDIEFVNDSIGFMYSYGTGNIYQTMDEGISWKIIKQTDSIYYEQIQFVNSKTGWICGENGSIFKTIDGGNTWTNQSIVEDGKNLLLYGMFFVDDATGYVSGAEFKDGKMHPVAYMTHDGGNSWIKTFEDIPHMILNLTAKGDVIFATGSNFIIRINPLTNEWKYAFRDTTRSTGQIRTLAFSDDNYVVAASFNGKILITKDGGNSFTLEEITKNRLRSIASLGNNAWLAAGDNNKSDGATLLYSPDNGKSWQKNVDFPDIHRIFLTEKYIWIVGKNGLLARKRRPVTSDQ